MTEEQKKQKVTLDIITADLYNDKIDRDDLSERAKIRSMRHMMVLEAKRVLRKAYEAGVTRKAMYLKMTDFSELLDDVFYRDQKGDGNYSAIDLPVYLCEHNTEWVKNGSAVLIDGGDSDQRLLVGRACLYRGILAMAANKADRLGTMLNFSEIMVRLGSFTGNRFAIVKHMKHLPVLFLYEVNCIHGVRNTSEAPALLDSILIYRKNYKLPTILSFSDNVETAMEIGLQFGSTFRSYVLCVKQRNYFPLQANSSVIRVRIKKK